MKENKNEEIEVLDVKEEKKNTKKEKKNNKELEKLQLENQMLNEKILRIAAEMQNMKRRYDEEISKMCKYEGEKLIKEILPVLDNFERAIQMDDDNLEDAVSKFLSGFKLIYSDFRGKLENIGVSEIKCLDTPFDPVYMEAVLTEKIEGREPGCVIDVLQKGYQYNDKVIRPAMVKVSE